VNAPEVAAFCYAVIGRPDLRVGFHRHTRQDRAGLSGKRGTLIASIPAPDFPLSSQRNHANGAKNPGADSLP
jgi:hypothetical protein